MASEQQRLLVLVEARVDGLEKQLKKASDVSRSRFKEVGDHAANARKRIEGETRAAAANANKSLASIGGNLAGLGKNFAAGFLGGFAAGGVQGFVSEIRSATRGMADLLAESKRAGVGVEAFQELSYGARQSNVSLEALTDGLKELQLRADEFIVTGKGSGAEAFERLGYSAEELKAKLRDPAALFVEIIGRLNALRDTAASIRIADEIFGGTGGEQFVQLIENGTAGLQRARDEARQLGVVIDEDVVRKGAELDRQFQRIADTIGVNIKNAVVSVATSLADWSTNVEGFLNSIGNSDFFRKLNDLTADKLDPSVTRIFAMPQGGNGLDPKAADALRRAMIAAGDRATTAVPDRAQQLPSTFVDPKLAGLRVDFQTNLAKLILAAKDAGHDLKIQSGFRSVERQQQLWAQAVAKYGSEAEARKWVAPPGRSYHNKGSAADLNFSGEGMTPNSASGRASRQWAQANAARFGLTFPLGNEGWHIEPAGQRGQGAMGDPDTSKLEGQAQKRTAAQIAADKQAEAVKRVMAALALETDQLGKTEAQQRVLQELQAAGVNVNSAEGQAIAAKVSKLYELKAAQEAAASSAEQIKAARETFADMGASATTGIISDLRNGVSAAEAFANALNRIADQLIEMAVQSLFKNAFATPAGGAAGGGGFFSFIGSMLGFEAGGYTGDGGRTEPAGVVHRGEYVVSAEATRRLGVDNLERMHRGAKGYAEGGLVGAPSFTPRTPSAVGGTPTSNVITLAPSVTVNASGGTPEQNDDLAKRVGREVDQNVRSIVSSELIKQLRPGGILGGGRSH